VCEHASHYAFMGDRYSDVRAVDLPSAWTPAIRWEVTQLNRQSNRGCFVHVLEGNVCDAEAMRAACHGAQAVYHLAAIVDTRRYDRDLLNSHGVPRCGGQFSVFTVCCLHAAAVVRATSPVCSTSTCEERKTCFKLPRRVASNDSFSCRVPRPWLGGRSTPLRCLPVAGRRRSSLPRAPH
jgi:hypothetical protein